MEPEPTKPLEPCVFGKGVLADELAATLNEKNDKRLTHRVCQFTTRYSFTLKEVDAIENFQTWTYVLELVRADFMEAAEVFADHGFLHTQVRNFVATEYQELLRTRTHLTKRGRMVPSEES